MKSLLVRVDSELCDASGKCARACPEIFHLDEYGYASTDEHRPVPEQLQRKVWKAAAACPTAAVVVDER